MSVSLRCHRFGRSAGAGRKRNHQPARTLRRAARIFQALHAMLFVLRSPVRGERLHAGQDGAVACTAADVAVEGVLDFLLGGVGIVDEELRHVHHEPDAAIAALRTVIKGQPVSHRINSFVRHLGRMSARSAKESDRRRSLVRESFLDGFEHGLIFSRDGERRLLDHRRYRRIGRSSRARSDERMMEQLRIRAPH